MNPDVQSSGKFTFPAREKLKHRKSIQCLFDKGRHITISPLKVIYLLTDEESIPKFSVSVPKKYFSKAVDRNRIKRQVRECYRLNKPLLKVACEALNTGIHMMWIYSNKSFVDTPALNKIMLQAIERLIIQVKKKVVKSTPE